MRTDKIIDFIIKNGEGRYSNLNRYKLQDFIDLHRKYGTLMTVEDKKGLAAVARWNWVNEKEVHILDVVIRKDTRSLKSLKALLWLGIKHNPRCETIRFQRVSKYKNNDFHIYRVKDFLRR